MVFSDFFRPLIVSCMEKPEARREAERVHLRKVEEKANFYVKWFHTTNEQKPEYREATNITRFVAESEPGTREIPGRRHPSLGLRDDGPVYLAKRF